jgi:S1-C subfamily serine protease
MKEKRELKLEWKLSDSDPNNMFIDIGFAVVNIINEAVHTQMPDLADLFPLGGCFVVQGYVANDWIAVRILGRYGPGVPRVEKIKDEDIKELTKKIEPFSPRNHQELFKLLGQDWFNFNMFTYVGPYAAPFACWPHASDHIVDWLNNLVVPEVLKRNQARVLRAIPPAPKFNLEIIRKGLWVLECEKTIRQGTAFNLSGVGLVTCEHVLGTATKAFRTSAINKKYLITVLAKNEEIDLAILKINTSLDEGLDVGSADNLKEMDHLAIAGFPNYRLGDTGVLVPGLVIGFRMVSGIRRILTNAPIVAGTSGGPVLDKDNRVIGVAVTGAEIMEKAQETEDHGIIPIDALKFLSA